jgi:CPA2 family monovalent cation:H+ antiporter-2
MHTLQVVLILMGASVLMVVLCRRVNLPPVLGYLCAGAVLGPHALNFMHNEQDASALAEFGVVFLMFSIGLEFSLSKLFSMKRTVFGLGLLQVIVTMLAMALISIGLGHSWQLGLALGAVLSMSSTAVLSKLLSDRMELDTLHGRDVMGVLLFQDLAVVPLLILLPALSRPPDQLLALMGIAVLKAAIALGLILYVGQKLVTRWFRFVAKAQSGEIFVLNVLLITLLLGYLTEQVGLSMALGAFVAGMLISETAYRFQVEEDIRPFRDVLMGLFFVTIGMKLDVPIVVHNFGAIIAALLAFLAVKGAVVGILSKCMGANSGNALRDALWLCAGGEFGFVLLGQAGQINKHVEQVVLAALLLSMLIAPFIVMSCEKVVTRFVRSEWMRKSMQITQVAAKSMAADRHAIICGFGRSGQAVARLLAQENVDYLAMDLDPERIRAAAAAGESVVFADAARRESLTAAGISRASVLIVSVDRANVCETILNNARDLRPDLPVVARAHDERDFEKLAAAGATEVVAASVEVSLMLASNALVLMGIPLHHVLRKAQEIRAQRYQLLRGYYSGLSDDANAEDERLASVWLAPGSGAIGHTLAEIGLGAMGVVVTAIRRRGIKADEPLPETRLAAGDVVILSGKGAMLADAEQALLRFSPAKAA